MYGKDKRGVKIFKRLNSERTFTLKLRTNVKSDIHGGKKFLTWRMVTMISLFIR